MRKITYLVAPLMVLPFLVGCNKTTTYKVSVAEGSDKHLVFKSEDGTKDLAQVRAEKGKDFKFKVEAVDRDGEQNLHRVAKDYIVVTIANKVLYDGYEVKYDEENEYSYAKATVTIDADKVVGDILVGGVASIKGYYVCNLPYLYGIDVEKIGEDVIKEGAYTHARIDSEITIQFKEGGTFGGAIYTLDDNDRTTIAPDGISEDKINNKITIAANVVKDSLTIIPRGSEAKWLDLFSWEEIKEISDSGHATELFNLGDTKKVKVNEIEHEVEIIGFNHDYITESTAAERKVAGITFQFKTLISDEKGVITCKWDEKTHQHYEGSTLDNYLNENVLGMIDEDLRNKIKPVYKEVAYWDDPDWKINQDHQVSLFPLSVVEANKESDYDVGGEGTKYLGKVGEALKDVKGTAHKYWLRSPSTARGAFDKILNYSIYIGTDGDIDGEVAPTAEALAPCFCI